MYLEAPSNYKHPPLSALKIQALTLIESFQRPNLQWVITRKIGSFLKGSLGCILIILYLSILASIVFAIIKPKLF